MIDIRAEQSGDEGAIHAVTKAAFAVAPHSGGNEQLIIDALRAGGDLSISLVALSDGLIVGHIAFSPVRIDGEDLGWYGLGPVSVVPERQGEGIGGDLIRTGLGELRKLDAAGCVLLGNPGYYGRFGFRHDPRLQYPGPPADKFQALAMRGKLPEGIVRYASAFA